MNRAQMRRAVLAVVVLLALAVAARHVARSWVGDPAAGSGPGGTATLACAALDDGGRAALGRLAWGQLAAPGGALPAAEDGCLVVVSLGRDGQPAWVAQAAGATAEAAVRRAVAELVGRVGVVPREGWLKVDVAVGQSEPERFDGEGHARIEPSLEGLWLPGPELLLLPEELSARELVDGRGDLQSGRLRRYLAEGGRSAPALGGNPGKAGMPYVRVQLDSFLAAAGGSVRRLYRGNDRAPGLSPAELLATSVAAGDYLLRHLLADGRFGYSYLPADDRYADDYNLLRHAGTCYALLELYQASGDRRYLEGAERGLAALLREVRAPRPEDEAAGFEAVVSPGEEAKLGGAALAMLALLQHRQATGRVEPAWAERTERMARFLLHQQEPSGRFESKYFYDQPDPEPFESIYYPGEAILALMRLYRVDPQERWLTAARRGADWLIEVRDAGKGDAELPHDHWLLMGLNELHAVTAEPRYLGHARRIAAAIVGAQRLDTPYLDWVGTYYDPPRSTPAATRAEALVAMHRLARRNGLDGSAYLETLLRMAAFQRRCQLAPENVLYLPRPDRALGGFRRGLTDWEVRIDYVQHNVSALLGLRAILLEQGGGGAAS